MTADDLVAALGLEPHPEGGWFRQTWAGPDRDGRPTGTCIHFLLREDEESRWHRVDATEIWHFHAGAPLILSRAETKAGPAREARLGTDVGAGEAPHLIVPIHHWQSARTTGAFTLVSCTVVPGFTFAGFELAPEGFDIPRL